MEKAKILVVEDEFIIAEDLCARIKNFGYDICGSVSTGEEAISTACEKKPDLILMDIILKDAMNGIEAASRIRDQYDIPIIYITAFGQKEYIDNAKITEPFGCLIKPFKDRELFATIEMALYKAKMERELLKSKKMEAMGVLAGGIAHDYNNLLAAIMGYISLAMDEVERDERAFELLQEAEKALFLARDLTQKFLTFSEGEAPMKQTISINELVKDATELALVGSNVRCEYLFPPDIWQVDIDYEQIWQVIHNIVINSKEAMPEGGTITVKGDNVTIQKGDSDLHLSGGAYVAIHISDEGVGIPEKDLHRIFDLYFSTKSRGSQKGMGFGLSIAYSIVRKHEGTIHVKSQPGIGTKVSVYLPASLKVVETVKEQKKIPAPVLDISSKRILFMDDEEMISEMAFYMLTHLGYIVEIAYEGETAIQKFKDAYLRGQPFDVVILDLTVKGGWGGKSTVQKLLEIDPKVHAIVTSGYSSDPIMCNYKEHGFRAAIPKPFTKAQLAEAIQDTLSENNSKVR